jgi:Flp pilus assembly protein TadD
MVVIAFTIDGNHRYNCRNNRRPLFVNWTRPRTWRRSTISWRRSAAFSASSRLIDLNGETNSLKRKKSSATRVVYDRDAVVNLARALLDAGYPREAATSLRTFVKRCGSAPEVLPLAFTGLERINDLSGALEVANELVEAVPASAAFRYWCGLAYDRTGKFSQAMLDYMNAIQLAGDPKHIGGEVFYKWAQSYAALVRYCDAIKAALRSAR